MVSHPETGSDPPIGSDRESGRDNNTFPFLGIVSLEPIGLQRFNHGLGSFVMLLCNFPIRISILVGIFAAGICDFVTFVESIKASGN